MRPRFESGHCHLLVDHLLRLTDEMAKDDIDRVYSQDPTVHRVLVVVDPPMEGRDVANFQRALRTRLAVRGLTDDVPVPTHGKFTHATWLAAVEAGYFLGFRSETYLAQTENGRGVSYKGVQTLVREPDKRTDAQRERAKDRHGQLDRGPRYYDDLAKTAGISGKGPEAALAWAAKQIGTVEQPRFSNWGPKIKDWIALTGYASPVPWCGCYANAALMAGGMPSGAGWMGYTPSIVSRAKGRVDGWSWHTTGKPGDLALFDTPGGDPAIHVGVTKAKLSDSTYATIEGNTTSGASGSQANGGGVFGRLRSTQGTFRLIGFARPPWNK